MKETSRYNFRTGEKNSFAKFGDVAIKIFKTGELQIKTASVVGVVEIAETSIDHGLGYIPMFEAYYRENTDSIYSPIPDSKNYFSGTTFLGLVGVNAYATNSKIFFQVQSSRTSVPLAVPIFIRYYIYNIPLNG